MRREPTRAEALLWKGLRRMEETDAHFRRQAPMGPYVVDFVCHSARLIVEVDGKVHALEQVALRDLERAAWLEGRGYRVLRVTNDEVTGDITSVLTRILSALGAGTPTPTPPRKGEGL